MISAGNRQQRQMLMITLVKDHGLQYLLAATILAGILQIIAGLFRLGSLMQFVSKSVMTGFVNALAILIFMAQLPELIGVPVLTYVMVAAGLGIIYLFPYVTKAIPSPLVCILVLTALSRSGLPSTSARWATWGSFRPPCRCSCFRRYRSTSKTLMIILPYSIAVAVVGLLESLIDCTDRRPT